MLSHQSNSINDIIPTTLQLPSIGATFTHEWILSSTFRLLFFYILCDWRVFMNWVKITKQVILRYYYYYFVKKKTKILKCSCKSVTKMKSTNTITASIYLICFTYMYVYVCVSLSYSLGYFGGCIRSDITLPNKKGIWFDKVK